MQSDKITIKQCLNLIKEKRKRLRERISLLILQSTTAYLALYGDICP